MAVHDIDMDHRCATALDSFDLLTQAREISRQDRWSDFNHLTNKALAGQRKGDCYPSRRGRESPTGSHNNRLIHYINDCLRMGCACVRRAEGSVAPSSNDPASEETIPRIPAGHPSHIRISGKLGSPRKDMVDDSAILFRFERAGSVDQDAAGGQGL